MWADGSTSPALLGQVAQASYLGDTKAYFINNVTRCSPK
jgi:hypothetical protein